MGEIFSSLEIGCGTNQGKFSIQGSKFMQVSTYSIPSNLSNFFDNEFTLVKQPYLPIYFLINSSNCFMSKKKDRKNFSRKLVLFGSMQFLLLSLKMNLIFYYYQPIPEELNVSQK